MGFIDDIRQFADQINKSLNYGPQVAQNLDPDNPYRPVFNNMMFGRPTLNAIEGASNWDINNRNTRLAEDQFAARTVNVTPDMLQRFQGYSPDNLNAHLPLAGTRYLNDVAAINQREEALRQQAKVKAAQASILSGMQPYMQQLQSTPQGSLTLNALQNPDAFTPEQWGTTYGQTPGIIQNGINRDATFGALTNVIAAMPDGGAKEIVKYLTPLSKLPGMEGTGTQVVNTALGSVPKPLTENDKLRNRLLQAQIDDIYADNQRADAKEKDAQAKGKKETQIKASDIANRIAASAASYRTYEDYVADLERHRGELIPLIGNAAYNRLVADAPNISENVFGSRFVPQHKRKVKSGYITFLLNELKKTQ